MAVFEYKNQADFARKFMALVEEIKDDPIESFFKHDWFMDFQPTPAQTVALKCIFKKKLDAKRKFKVFQEIKTDDDMFDLDELEMTEVELYEFMTGRQYNPLNYTAHRTYINKNKRS